MKKLLLALVLSLMALTSQAQFAKLGDINHDNDVTINDVMMLVDIVLNGYNSFSVEPTDVTIPIGGSAMVNIFGGYNYYEVTSMNPEVVVASLNGTFITLSAVSGGETTVIVKDVQTFRSISIPVKVNYNALEISSSQLSLVAGEEGTIDITSGSGSYNVQSSDNNVATASVTGSSIKVTAIGVGTATITVTDTKTGQTVAIEVTVRAIPSPVSYLTCPNNNHPHLIDLDLPSGTKWACCNVDADHPEKQSPTNYGGYFAWGETKTKTTYDWSTYIHCDGSGNTCHDLGDNISGTQYDVAHVKWGGNWIMPTDVEIEELYTYCTSVWTTQNGFKGRKFTGSNGGSIFMPAAGGRSLSAIYDAGNKGFYWSSTPSSSSLGSSNILFFDYRSLCGETSGCCYGRNIRPVSR